MATPMAITRAPLRTVRPANLAGVYTQPRIQLQRLAKNGRVVHLAHGYYCAIPDDQGPNWQPVSSAASPEQSAGQRSPSPNSTNRSA